VLNEALAQCRNWQDRGWPLGVAVNLSGRLLQDPSLADLVSELLHRWRVDASCLVLELTESSIMSDPERVSGVLERLREIHVQLSIDDFGTGYSSLSHLRLLPVDEIKIDKSFVLDMLVNPPDEAIVHSTIQLCQNLGRQVVAEGVEDEATYRRLIELGCDRAQGFYFARAMSADALAGWVEGGGWRMG
jgi:EAL domain-containing protein (putative c-di-GMP-specific phosphodiesterase class I)